MNAAVKNSIQNFYLGNKQAVDSLADYLGVPPLWVVSVWYNESGLNKSIINGIGAAGLNQMTPATLQQYGLTPQQYAAKSVAEQVEVMKQFYAPVKGRIKRAGDLYLYNFWPAAIINNYYSQQAIARKGQAAYDSNSSLDYNNDGVITRKDVTDYFENKYDEVTQGYGFVRDLWIDIKTNWVVWLLVFLLVAGALYYSYTTLNVK